MMLSHRARDRLPYNSRKQTDPPKPKLSPEEFVYLIVPGDFARPVKGYFALRDSNGIIHTIDGKFSSRAARVRPLRGNDLLLLQNEEAISDIKKRMNLYSRLSKYEDRIRIERLFKRCIRNLSIQIRRASLDSFLV